MVTQARRRTSLQSTTRYAVYLRCSSDEQADKEYSTIDTQRELTEQYVREHRGVITKVYSDEGRSGTNLQRPGWKDLLCDAESGRFDAVVVTYMSRLARGPKYYVAEHLLEACHVRIETVKEFFGDDMPGYMNKQITQFMDGMYCKQVSQFTRTKMEQMAANGYFCGGMPPFGYTKEVIDGAAAGKGKEPPKRLIPEPAEAEVVREAFELFTASRSLSSVRDLLNSKTTRKWNTDRAKYLLRNEVYLGILAFGDWRNEDAYEPIVDRELWDAVNEVLASHKTVRPARTTEYAFYLRGRLTCPHCGCIYTPYPCKSGTVLYYACINGMKKRSICPVMRINVKALHYSILREIERAARHNTVMRRIISDSGGWQTIGDDTRAIRGQLGKKKQLLGVQVGNIANAIAMGGDMAGLVGKMKKLEQELAQVDQDIKRTDAKIHQATIKRPVAMDVQNSWSELLDLWPELTELEREEALGSVVQKVEVTTKNLVHLELSPIAEFRGSKFVTTPKRERGSDSN